MVRIDDKLRLHIAAVTCDILDCRVNIQSPGAVAAVAAVLGDFGAALGAVRAACSWDTSHGEPVCGQNVGGLWWINLIIVHD